MATAKWPLGNGQRTNKDGCPDRFCTVGKVPEGHHPRGITLHEALRGNLPEALRGFSGASAVAFAGVSAGVSSRSLRASAGVRGIFWGQ